MMLKLIEEEYVRYAEHLTEEETTSLSKAKQQKEDRRQAAILREASMGFISKGVTCSPTFKKKEGSSS